MNVSTGIFKSVASGALSSQQKIYLAFRVRMGEDGALGRDMSRASHSSSKKTMFTELLHVLGVECRSEHDAGDRKQALRSGGG